MVKGGIPFPMLSDQGGRIGDVYGVYDKAAGVDIRGRFLIDPDAVIQAMEVLTYRITTTGPYSKYGFSSQIGLHIKSKVNPPALPVRIYMALPF